jgi:uncharacterized protein (DUF1778 family)
VEGGGGRRAMRQNTARRRRINLRVTEREEILIRDGAHAAGISESEFILESACRRAEDALADKCDFVVNARRWKAFVNAVERPARIKPELAHRLRMARSQEWLRHSESKTRRGRCEVAR